jgi:uncharacterized DUF497 family protein
VLEFDWDPAKAAANARKHGVTFYEATAAFLDPLSLTIEDPTGGHGEQRYILLGMTRALRLVAVVHTERGDTIRLISARGATRGERRAYEQA